MKREKNANELLSKAATVSLLVCLLFLKNLRSPKAQRLKFPTI